MIVRGVWGRGTGRVEIWRRTGAAFEQQIIQQWFPLMWQPVQLKIFERIVKNQLQILLSSSGDSSLFYTYMKTPHMKKTHFRPIFFCLLFAI